MGYEQNWKDSTVFIGDNLKVMREMNSGHIDLIYLDPPFNSNHNYAAPIGSEAAGAEFKDTWTLSDIDVEWHGYIADKHPPLYSLIKTAGEVHGDSMKLYLIYMAIRILEMKRLLKPTGSIYLHCDPTAGHYLKLVMDAIFGNKNFLNEISWKRTGSHGSAKRWGSIHDIILYYGPAKDRAWNRVLQPLEQDYIDSFYKMHDEKGRYQLVTLTGAGTTGGESGKPWRGVDPGESGRHWSIPRENAFPDWFVIPPLWKTMSTQERLDKLDEAELISWPKKKGGKPRFKRYLTEKSGQPIQDIITDIRPLGAHAAERVGYPTQKPKALLERIIKASSNEGDIVFDPFCGCATTLIAAQNELRKWVGIDISPKAGEVIQLRMRKELNLLFNGTIAEDPPRRTPEDRIDDEFFRDVKNLPYNHPAIKQLLFGHQNERCDGCLEVFKFKMFEVDHIVPRVKGGTDRFDNLQLLCPPCNRRKGDKSMKEFSAMMLREKEEDIRKKESELEKMRQLQLDL